MTGFARMARQSALISWIWEIKSVNSKGLDVRCRIPSGYDALELACRNAIATKFARGNFSISLTVTKSENQGNYYINQDVLMQYLANARSLDLGDVAPPRLDGLLSLRGVIESVVDEQSEDQQELEMKEMLVDFDHVLNELAKNRKSEGARMAVVLKQHLEDIKILSQTAISCAALQPEALKNRLVRQLKAVITDIPELDQERISQEAALIMTKADVKEELDRLQSHIEAAGEILEKGSPCGRKLDFLCQEFNREANTICSKSQDIELTRIGLDLKSVIEQFREQVQNIE